MAKLHLFFNKAFLYVKVFICDRLFDQCPIDCAFAYTLTLWPRLVRYIDDGRFYIGNNLIENSIRPVALGRKNYMFAGSHAAAQQAAVIYSLVGSCKINNIEPFSYLTKTFSLIPDHPANNLHTLLPGQK